MNVTALDSGWRERAAALAEQVATAGVLTDARWRAALEHTPRHVFVPRFYEGNTVVDGSDPNSREAWLNAVYSDDSLVVQRATAPGNGHGWPTSSSTMPSLMVRMLQLLEVDDDSPVLEIGTATGYNAALLCHRLGADQVASIELHPQLGADAARRLATLGYHPALAIGDGAAGMPCAAPFDRIIATCAVPAIPATWIQQLGPGGRIVVDLQSELSSNLTVLDQTTPGTVSGRLLEQSGHFMWLRPELASPLLDPSRYEFTADQGTAETSAVDMDPGLLAEPGLRVLLGFGEPTLSCSRSERDGIERWWLDAQGGSWAEIIDGRVTQGGPRRLWPAVERAVAEWRRLDQPGPWRYGLTADTGGHHRLWIDSPDNVVNDHGHRVGAPGSRPERP